MSTRTGLRLTVVALAAVAGLYLLPSPAKAAVTSGTAQGGRGSAACNLTVSCLAFTTQCSLSAANDLDASVRRAEVGGQVRPITWSLTPLSLAAEHELQVQPFNASCDAISLPSTLASGASMFFPHGTVYVAVWPTDPFYQLSWTLH